MPALTSGGERLPDLWARPAVACRGLATTGMVGLAEKRENRLAQGADTMDCAGQPAIASVRTVGVGDTQLDYAVFGTGEKAFVILPGLSVHSVMGSAQAVANAYKDFADRYTVYLFDQVKDVREGYGVGQLAVDTALAMRALGIEGADVFGASMGGMVALRLAIDAPELVNRLVLASTAAMPNATSTRIIGEWICLAEARDEAGLLQSFVDAVYSEATLRKFGNFLVSSNAGITDAEFRRFAILARVCASFDCSSELASVTCPTLVLGSKGDHVLGAEGSEQIAEALGCELYLYGDDYGHAVYDEAPDFRQRMLEFLTSGE